jgi:hypothetical protein
VKTQNTLARETHLENVRQKLQEFINNEILAVNLDNSEDELDNMAEHLEDSLMNTIKHSLEVSGAIFK